jgi:hypothetical protein
VVLAEFPMSDDYGLNTPFLYFSLWHWAPMVNGYSGFLPASYVSFQKQVASFPESAAFDAMRLRGVTHVTVNCGLYRGPCDGLLAAIDARPDVTLTASGRWRNQPVRLYRLEPR